MRGPLDVVAESDDSLVASSTAQSIAAHRLETGVRLTIGQLAAPNVQWVALRA